MTDRLPAVAIAFTAITLAGCAFWLDWRAALLMAGANVLDRMFSRQVKQ